MSLCTKFEILVKFVILWLLVDFFGCFLVEQHEEVPIYCEVLKLNFVKNQYSNSYCSARILREKLFWRKNFEITRQKNMNNLIFCTLQLSTVIKSPRMETFLFIHTQYSWRRQLFLVPSSLLQWRVESESWEAC